MGGGSMKLLFNLANIEQVTVYQKQLLLLLYICYVSINTSYLLRLLDTVGWASGSCKNRGADVVICLERGADCLHIVQLMPLPSQNTIISCLIYIQTGFTFLVPAYQGCPGKEAVIVVVMVVVIVNNYLRSADARWRGRAGRPMAGWVGCWL